MKNKLMWLLVIVLVLSMCISLVGCDGEGTADVVPVYLGMTVANASSSTTATSKVSMSNFVAVDKDDDDDDDDDDRKGSFSGDTSTQNDDIDQEDPFDGYDIEQSASSDLTVTGAEEKIYYATSGSSVQISIHIDNPSQYEILSFTLNGTKYSSYMFDTGSDMETLLLTVDVGSTAGIKEYTIDAIKYVDGVDICDVSMEGDDTVSIGIWQSNMVTATLSNEVVTLDSISFDAKISDGYSLVELSEGYLTAVLYSEDTLVASKTLSVGSNSVTFDNLDSNTLYQYAVVGVYDDLVEGSRTNVLASCAVYTETIVLFDNISVTQDSVSWSYLWNSLAANQTITKLIVTHSGTTTTLASTATSISNLLSDNSYTVTAQYTNTAGDSETIQFQFTTAAKATPVVAIVDTASTQDSISFDLAITDTNSVGSITSVELYLGDTLVASLDSFDSLAFAGLLSNNQYTIKVVYTYDLCDGEGDHAIELSTDVTTEAKATPVVAIVDTASTQDSISFDLTITDTDSVGSITSVELYLGETLVESLDSFDSLAFAGLLSNNQYTIKVVYTYDLCDGEGDHAIELSTDVTTEAKATPVVAIVDTASTQDSITFDLTITDTDSVGSITSVELYLGDTLVASLDSFDSLAFDSLLSNNQYTIKVVYTYDLCDGEGDHAIELSTDVTTEAKATPVVAIVDTASTQDSISFDLAITDTDSVGSITSVELYLGDTLVASLDSFDTLSFHNLTNNSYYTISVICSYDLSDGIGTRTMTVDSYVWTAPIMDFVSATVANTSAVSAGEIIYFEAVIDNPDNVTIDSITINGVQYATSSGTKQNSIIVNIIVEGQFAGGDTELTVTEIVGTLNGITRTYYIEDNNIATVFVNGELTVDGIYIGNVLAEEVDYAVAGTTSYYIVQLSNDTGYSIDSIVIDGTTYSSDSITMLDNNTASIAFLPSSGSNSVSVTSISYSNQYLTNSKTIVYISIICNTLSNSTVIYISTQEDLLNMNGGGYYELTSDIEITGEWSSMGSFSGYFDGCGYTISGLNYVGTLENSDLYWGLFNTASGIITNLNVSGRVILTMTSTTSTIYNVYAGGISAQASNLQLIGVSSSIDISISGTVADSRIGGLVGHARGAIEIIASYNTGDISSAGSYGIGGIVGFIDCSDVSIISNSYNTGNISGIIYVGGLVGGTNWNSYVIIANCYNNGEVSSMHGSVGGMLGHLTSGVIIITNSYSVGAILVGYANGTTAIINSYITTAGTVTYGGEVATLEDILAELELVWDSEMWVFGDSHPTLAWQE